MRGIRWKNKLRQVDLELGRKEKAVAKKREVTCYYDMFLTRPYSTLKLLFFCFSSFFFIIKNEDAIDFFLFLFTLLPS